MIPTELGINHVYLANVLLVNKLSFSIRRIYSTSKQIDHIWIFSRNFDTNLNI